MKVLTKYVVIGNQEFVLIKDEHRGHTYYGTIPYSEIDEKGCMKRELNGHEMCITFNGVSDAIVQRENRIKVDRYRENHSKAEVYMFIAMGYTEQNWDEEMFEKVKTLCD